MAKTITLPGAPGTGELYGKAVTGMLPGIGKPARVPADATVPDTHYRLDDVRVDPAALQAYCHATGQRFGITLPVTYPFVLQFPVVMKLLTSDEFPFGAIGSVHMTNKIERKRPIEVGEPLSIETHAENLREHRKGILVDLISEISVGSELVTTQTATFLKQQRTSLSDEPRGPEPKSKTPPPPDSILAVDLGRIREYAAASGDRNPIHMANLTAKAFGFPKAIAHGMWSAAAAVANVESQLPGRVTYDVKFGKPILLPAKVNLYTRRIDGEGNFDIAIRDRRRGFPHLTATTRKG
ncbi:MULTISPECIES: MaoC/PaaZ C-terminal domain-containing protein [Gordonia]|uniref:MaoC/PaaZ C-terminal domain-containing protein n=1 Tax=Gordonia amicalis TaxID=89053 RepID=A0AAE4R435_9ACTN|nr:MULTISPECIES: MaoC/PaaZ C-terminal domain-containing protein [Gordonia]ATD73299.1 hypothetical protein CNO18_21760 [Gordonia sp. 1D]MCZ0915074.1 MaoC/PaaZ C-terminal domain-containing protein [Gordonia amicalis]MCZ4652530.1 MaoC/PaaZ C-terminal domain-containing protein [Gordonia amicalis]MDJ0455255.1 MaoC/PaaZ C-terminal domain-containing protein [Gordonia amicalis]MDV6309036.1 MaoC/PaaZ C-terminal domain-containing protein [Gordonia amicalis]